MATFDCSLEFEFIGLEHTFFGDFRADKLAAGRGGKCLFIGIFFIPFKLKDCVRNISQLDHDSPEEQLSSH